MEVGLWESAGQTLHSDRHTTDSAYEFLNYLAMSGNEEILRKIICTRHPLLRT